ncbi:MAG TPA: hypothetical protein VFC62_03055 [Atopostipes sp.]|nr:hypothetical protein [Atopostipes sp.]
MKRIKQSSLIIFSGFLLVACGENATDNWTENIQKCNEGLESYSSDTQLDLELNIGSGVMAEQDEAFIHVSMIGDLEEGYIEQGTELLYFVGNDVHVYEGGTWNFYPNGGPIDYPSFYPNIIDSLVEIEDLIEATHTNGSVELFYEGNDREVWDAFEDEFALSIDGVDEENINIALEAVLDDENYYLQEFRMDILGEETDDDVQLGSINIQVDVDYYDHDNVDLSDIEAEVIE